MKCLLHKNVYAIRDITLPSSIHFIHINRYEHTHTWKINKPKARTHYERRSNQGKRYFGVPVSIISWLGFGGDLCRRRRRGSSWSGCGSSRWLIWFEESIPIHRPEGWDWTRFKFSHVGPLLLYLWVITFSSHSSTVRLLWFPMTPNNDNNPKDSVLLNPPKFGFLSLKPEGWELFPYFLFFPCFIVLWCDYGFGDCWQFSSLFLLWGDFRRLAE
mgnify:CR=1 FL=1